MNYDYSNALLTVLKKEKAGNVLRKRKICTSKQGPVTHTV